jgi:hypothetical protein
MIKLDLLVPQKLSIDLSLLSIKDPEQKIKELEKSEEDCEGELAFGRAVGLHFLRERSKLPNSTGVILQEEKAKNIYLAKLFFRKIKKRELEIETTEDINKIYKQYEDVEFWKDKISYMFKYADSDALKFYSQTVKGAIGFYFKHYQRLKNIVESKSLSSDEKEIQAFVRAWKREDAINCFYCYLVKIYRHLKPQVNYATRQDYYKYIKYISSISTPKIKNIVLENSPLLRGLLLSFKDKFEQWCLIKEVNIKDIFDYEEFEKLCEEKGVEFENSLFDGKELNDIISDAMYKFTQVQ